MTAILELIKTLIPFAIAFLFLWGIGRICCTNPASNNKKPQSEKSVETDEDEQEKQSQLKAQLKKKHGNKKRKDAFSSKQGTFAGKRDLFSSHENLMADKSDMFSDKKPLIGKRANRTSGLGIVLSSPSGKKRKLTPLQQAFLLKEVLDAPKAIKPYQSKYPR